MKRSHYSILTLVACLLFACAAAGFAVSFRLTSTDRLEAARMRLEAHASGRLVLSEDRIADILEEMAREEERARAYAEAVVHFFRYFSGFLLLLAAMQAIEIIRLRRRDRRTGGG